MGVPPNSAFPGGLPNTRPAAPNLRNGQRADVSFRPSVEILAFAADEASLSEIEERKATVSRFKNIPAQPSPLPAASGGPVNPSRPSAQQSTKGFFALGMLSAIVVFFMLLMIGANSSRRTPAIPSSTFGPAENRDSSSRTSQTEPTPQPWRGLVEPRDQPPASQPLPQPTTTKEAQPAAGTPTSPISQSGELQPKSTPPVGTPTPPGAPPEPPDHAPTLLDLNKNEDAKRVQLRLIELKFLFGTADGNWGPLSEQALREFRKAQRIGRDATWSLDTQRQLFSQTAAHPVSAAAATYLGGWGVSLEQCRQTSGSSPLTITALRAESYGAICEFAKAQQAGPNVWHIRAACMSDGKKWKDNIALTVSEDKLAWVTERRNDQYVRCPSSLAERGSFADYNVSRHGSFVERERRRDLVR